MDFVDDQQMFDFHQSAARLELLGEELQAARNKDVVAQKIAEAANALQVLVLIHQDVVQRTCDHGGMKPDVMGASPASCRRCGIPVKMER